MNKSILAINGGKPVRTNTLQYGKQTIEIPDIQAVIKVLNENKYLTTGPRINQFETEMAKYTGVKYGVAVSSATAGLHCAIMTCNIGEGDEVIVPAISFVASANCVLYCGAKPVFVDIEEDTLNIDPKKIEKEITSKTKAVIMVDMTGYPANYNEIYKICKKYNLILIQDAAHSIGTSLLINDKYKPNIYYRHMKVGSYSDMTVFSFHPVKNMTTAEGGMVMTNSKEFYNKLLKFRSHGIDVDYKEREEKGSHCYDMKILGFNYRMTDIQAALGISQLKRLDNWIGIRRYVVENYDNIFQNLPKYLESFPRPNILYPSAYHIYPIRLKLQNLNANRDQIFKALKAEGIGVNVHYKPIYLHSYYQNLRNTKGWNYPVGLCPIAEQRYQELITLPIFPTMKGDDILDVIEAVKKVISYYAK